MISRAEEKLLEDVAALRERIAKGRIKDPAGSCAKERKHTRVEARKSLFPFHQI
jgi:hypothetical protein